MRVEVVREGFVKMQGLLKGISLKVKDLDMPSTEGSSSLRRIQYTVVKALGELETKGVGGLNLKQRELSVDLVNLEQIDYQYWKSGDFKAFLLALKELGVSTEDFLINTFISFFGGMFFDNAVESFIEVFPEIKTMQFSGEYEGQTLFSIACSKGLDQKALYYMIQHKFDVATPDLHGKTPLHHFATCETYKQWAYTESIGFFSEFFFQPELNLNAQDEKGNTALHLGILNGSIAFAGALMNAPIDLNLANRKGQTPAHLSLVDYKGPADCFLPNLIQCGAKLDVLDKKGNSLLHYACLNASDTEIAILLENGADPLCKNKHSITPAENLAGNVGVPRELKACLEASKEATLLIEGTGAFDLSNPKGRASIVLLLIQKAALVTDWHDPDLAARFEFDQFIIQVALAAYNTDDQDLFRFMHIYLTMARLPNKLMEQTITLEKPKFFEICLEREAYFDGATEKGHTLLSLAVQSGNVKSLLICLKECKSQEIIEQALGLAADMKLFNILFVFIKKRHFDQKLKIDGKPILDFFVENKMWKMLDAVCEFSISQTYPLNFSDDVLRLVISDAVDASQFELISQLIVLGKVDIFDPSIGKPLMEAAIRKKAWQFVNDYIEYHNSYREITIDGKSIAYLAASDQGEDDITNAICVVNYMAVQTGFDFTQTHDGKSFVSLCVEGKFWMVLSRYLYLRGEQEVSFGSHAPQEVLKLALADHDGHDAWDFAYDLILKGVRTVNMSFNGMPIIHYATRFRSKENVIRLLNAKVPLKEVDASDRSALYYALQNGDVLISRLLIEAGVDIHLEEWNFNLDASFVMKVIGGLRNPELRSAIIHNSFECQLLLTLYDIDMPGVDTNIFDIRDAPSGMVGSMRELAEFISTQPIAKAGDIPDIEYRGDPFAELNKIFAQCTDEELKGVLGIDEMEVSPAQQRTNFEHFLSICKQKVIITGVLRGNRDAVYEPIRRMIKHLALKLPGLDRAEQLTLITQISRIQKGYCIDPYKKMAHWVYGMLESQKEGEQVALDLGDPVTTMRRDLYQRFASIRDIAFAHILKESEGKIDTHARNWAYKHFGPAIGLAFDEEDIHLEGHGLEQLSIFLNRAPGDRGQNLLLELYARFFSYFIGFSAQTFCHVLKKEFASQDLMGDSGDVRSQVAIDYFHELVERQKASKLESISEVPEEKQAAQDYLKWSARTSKVEKTLSGKKFEIANLKRMQEMRTQRLAPQSEDAELDRGIEEGQVKLINPRPEDAELRRSIERKLEEGKLKLKELNEAASDLEKEVQDFAAQRSRIANAHSQITEKVDGLLEKSQSLHAAISDEFLSYDERGVHLSTKGAWECFKLFFIYERTQI